LSPRGEACAGGEKGRALGPKPTTRHGARRVDPAWFRLDRDAEALVAGLMQSHVQESKPQMDKRELPSSPQREVF
jgi:hypothetical protein